MWTWLYHRIIQGFFFRLTMCDFDLGEDDSWMLEGPEPDLNNAICEISDQTLCQLDETFNESSFVNTGQPNLNDAVVVTNLASNQTLGVLKSDETMEIDKEIWSEAQENNLNRLIEELENNGSSQRNLVDQPVDAEPKCSSTLPPTNSKVLTLTDLVLQLTDCCSKASRKMTHHLEKSERCRAKIANLLGLSPDSSTISVMRKRKKALRTANYNERNKRRNTMKRTTQKKFSEVKKKIGAVQKVYICYSCKFTSNKKENLIESIPNSVLPKSYETDSAYFLCVRCEGGPGSIPPITTLDKRSFLKQSSIDRRSVLVPENDLTQSCHLTFPPTLFIPNAFPTKTWWNCNELPELRPDLLRFTKVNTALVAEAISVSDLADALYEHRLASILQRKGNCSLYKGKIISLENRTIKISPMKPNLSRIKGTSDYYQRLYNESQVAFHYFGKTAIQVQVELKKSPEEIWKIFLVEENKVAVVQKESNGKLSYEVHKNHRSLEPCVDNCEITPLRSYLEDRNLHDIYLEEPRFLNILCEHYRRLFQHYTGFISNLDEIRSDNYVSTIHFPLSSEPVLKMILWPEFLENFNRKLVSDESVNLEDVRVLESKFDSVLTTVIDSGDVGSQSSEQTEMSKLVHNLYDSSMGSMPSNYNLVKRPVIPRGDDWGLSEVCNTTETLFVVKTYFLEILNSVSKESFNIESVQTLNNVLNCISSTDGFKCELTENQFTIKFPGREMIKCRIDEVLYKYLTDDKQSAIEAIYHRALSITRAQDDFTLIVKRPNLSSAYISAYNSNILKLSKSKCYISFVSTDINTTCSEMTIPCIQKYDSQTQFSADHEEVSMVKAFYLTGGKKFRLTLRSNAPIFFEPNLKKQKTYKKVSSHDPNKHYQDLNSGQWLEKVNDIYDLYLDRLGCEDLTFMQFCMHFHQSGNDDENGDTEMISETPVSDVCIKLISFDGHQEFETLPQVIELRSGKKMTLQKNPKLLYYPKVDIGSEDFKEISVLFYYPHRDTAHVQLFIDEIFNAKSERFKGKTKVEVTRMLLHPFFSLDLYSSM